MEYTSAQRVSIVTGKPIEQVQKDLDRNKKSNDLLMELVEEIGKISKDDFELLINIQSIISTILYKLPKDIAIDALDNIKILFLDNRAEELKKILKTFKEES